MTSVVVDRRAQKGKSTANRQRVLKRLEGSLKAQVDELVSKRKLKDTDKAAEVRIDRKDVSEPRFSLDGSSGTSGRIVPGNDQYRVGDKIAQKKAGQGGTGSGGESGDGSGGEGGGFEDNFRFVLSREEYLSLLFDDLALPELVRKDLLDIDESKFRRGGVSRYGNPGNVCMVRTFKASIGRRIAAQAQSEEAIEAAEAELSVALNIGTPALIYAAELVLKEARQHTLEIPFLDPVDLRHRSLIEVQAPRTAAVMFCLMDVSASMTEPRKNLAKRFFTLLYLFLLRKYEAVEIVFIRHTDQAQEVSEDEFFNGTQTGSTKVLSALEKMKEIIETRFPARSYNIFGAQASDGDAFDKDPAQSTTFLTDKLLPLSRYFVYAQVGDAAAAAYSAIGPSNIAASTDLWKAYASIKNERFNMAGISAKDQVYPALAKLFEKA